MSDEIKFEEAKSRYPKSISIISQEPSKIELDLIATSVRRTSIGYLLMFAAIIGGLIFGIVVATASVGLGIILGLAAISGGIWFVLRLMQNKTRIIVTPKALTMNKKNYRRTQWEGFRPGTERVVGNRGELPVVDLTFIYGGATEKTGLSLSAHPGEDISPVDTINALNELIATVPLEGFDKPSNQSAKGKRDQAF